MAEKTIVVAFLVFLILQHNFGSIAASGKNIIHPPPPAIPRVFLRSPQPPSLGYTINDDEDGQGDAYRPTSPGHSPGVGHNAPPNRP